MSIREIRKGGASVNTVMQCLEGDVKAYTEIPAPIREYMDTMHEPPRPEIVLRSINMFGARETMAALHMKQDMDGFQRRSEEARKRDRQRH